MTLNWTIWRAPNFIVFKLSATDTVTPYYYGNIFILNDWSICSYEVRIHSKLERKLHSRDFECGGIFTNPSSKNAGSTLRALLS